MSANMELARTTDAGLYVSLVQSLALPQNQKQFLINIQNIQQKIGNSTPHYVSTSNLLNILLVHTLPGLIPYSIVLQAARYILETSLEKEIGPVEKEIDNEDNDNDKDNDKDTEREDHDIENKIEEQVPIQNETSLIETADNLLQETNHKAADILDFEYNKFASVNANLLGFLQAKTFALSQFYNDLNEIDDLFDNIEFREFQDWNEGVLMPYTYYWSNYGAEYSLSLMSLQTYLQSSYNEKFDKLVQPLTNGQIQTSEEWLLQTIIPLLKYHDYNIDALDRWMFQVYKGSILKKFGLWNIVFRLLNLEVLKSEHTSTTLMIKMKTKIIPHYLASCYYYNLNGNANSLSSVELMKLYDTIKATLANIIDNEDEFKNEPKELLLGEVDLSVGSNETMTYKEFSSESNPLAILFKPEYAQFLLRAIATCQRLYPISQITMQEYLQLKLTSDNSNDKGNGLSSNLAQKELMKIMNNVNATNWKLMYQLILQFKNEFVLNSNRAKADYVIVERLLMSGLIEESEELVRDHKTELSPIEIYEVFMDKFWESFNSANNINDKIGHLHQARRCLDIIEQLPEYTQLPATKREKIIALKHLFKAMSAMKNFKIVVERNKPFTPSQLVKFSNHSAHEQLGKKECFLLITVILEQNPKSYLAFEKLFRILNDLLLYFELDSSTVDTNLYFSKLKTACIESALVDNNFSYAYTQSIELFEHFGNLLSNDFNIDQFWLTFYQVGKFVSPGWLDNADPQEMQKVWIKQRQILSLTLQRLDCGDHSRVILDQWNKVNAKLEENSRDTNVANMRQFQIQKEMNNAKSDSAWSLGLHPQDIINDASHSTNKAGEKISNLFVSGLGWAIGANR